MHVYVGPGHHRRRTNWASPLTPGHDCSLDDWLPRYVEHVRGTLWDDLHELEGMTLVRDCSHGGFCEADMLAGLVFEALSPTARELYPGVLGRVASQVASGPVGECRFCHQHLQAEC